MNREGRVWVGDVWLRDWDYRIVLERIHFGNAGVCNSSIDIVTRQSPDELGLLTRVVAVVAVPIPRGRWCERETRLLFHPLATICALLEQLAAERAADYDIDIRVLRSPQQKFWQSVNR